MKQKFIEFCNTNKKMLITFATVWVIFFIFDCLYPKIQTHLILNGYHSPVLDTIFKFITKLGEGFPMYFGLALLLWNFNAFFNRRNGLFIVLSQALTFLFTQALKFAFAHPRPATYFNQMGAELPETVPGVSLRRAMNSFPSGHTSAAFAFFACLALMTPRKWSPLWITAGWAVAYSRIYLSQHFLEDILLGSVIGMLSSCLVYMIMDHYINRKTNLLNN